MQTINCDVCKKKIEDSFTGRNFFYFATHSVCEPCKENMESQIRQTLRTKEPYTYDMYCKIVDETFSKAISKGSK